MSQRLSCIYAFHAAGSLPAAVRRSESSVPAGPHTVQHVTQTSTPREGTCYTVGHGCTSLAHACWAQCTSTTCHTGTQHCTLTPTQSHISGPSELQPATVTNTGPQRSNATEGGGDREAASRQTCPPDTHAQGDTMTAPHAPQAPTLYNTRSSLSFPHSNGILHPAAQIRPDAGGGEWNVLAHPSTSPSRKPQILYSFLGTSSLRFPFLRDPGPGIQTEGRERKQNKKTRRQIGL